MVGSLANSWLYDVTVRCCYAYFVMLAFAALPAPLPKNVLYGFGTFWPTICVFIKGSFEIAKGKNKTRPAIKKT